MARRPPFLRPAIAFAAFGTGLFVLFVGYAGWLSISAAAKRADEMNHAPKVEPVRAIATVNSCDVSWMRVSVTDVGVQTVRSTTVLGLNAESTEPHLVIQLAVTITDPTRIHTFRTWGKDKRGQAVRLVDNFGNVYPQYHASNGSTINGQTDGTTVRAGEFVKDVIVYDKPPPAVTHLDLDLLARDVGGGDEWFRFRIPADLWRK